MRSEFKIIQWFFLLLLTALFACKSQPDTAQESPEEFNSSQHSLPTENENCDPPPPCLDPWEHPISIPFHSNTRPDSSFTVLVSKSRKNDNYYVSINSATNHKNSEITLLQPFRLKKNAEGFHQFFIQDQQGKEDTLFIQFRKKIIDCCPQLFPAKIRLNKKVICDDCQEWPIIKLE